MQEKKQISKWAAPANLSAGVLMLMLLLMVGKQSILLAIGLFFLASLFLRAGVTAILVRRNGGNAKRSKKGIPIRFFAPAGLGMGFICMMVALLLNNKSEEPALPVLILAIISICFFVIGFIGVKLRTKEKKAEFDNQQRQKREEERRIALEKEEEERRAALEKAQEERRAAWENAQEKRRQHVEAARIAFAMELEAIDREELEVSEKAAPRKKPYELPEIRPVNITKKTRLENIFPLVVIDTETTGLNPSKSDVIEVSAIRYEFDFTPTSCVTALCKPRNPIPEAASAVNHITDDMVENCPTFGQIAASLAKYMHGCTVVAHNADFDLKHMMCGGLELPKRTRVYDTLALAKLVLDSPRSTEWDREEGRAVAVSTWDVENYKLGTLCEHYGIYPSEAHRSLADAYATGLLFQRLVEEKTAME